MVEFALSVKDLTLEFCSLRLPATRATFTLTIAIRLFLLHIFLAATVGLFG